MKIFFYLAGLLIILYALMLYYEDKREKDFLKNDLQSAGRVFVDDLNSSESVAQKMKENNEIELAEKNNTTLMDEFYNTIQGEIRRGYDDVRGAVKIR